MSSPPAPKISHHNRGQPNKQEELYEEVEMHEEEQPRYMTTIHPNHVDIDDNSQIVGKISTKTKRWKCVVIALIAVCALIVCFVAVIIYSPLVSGGDNTGSSTSSTTEAGLLSKIQQLEAMLQGTNHSFKSLQESLESLGAQVQQQSDYNSSQILNSVQNLSLEQNVIRQDLDRLRTINLFEGCYEVTRVCQVSTLSNSTYRSCRTNGVTLSPGDTEYFTSNLLCDFSYTDYFTSSTYYKIGNDIYCYCEITYPSSTGHNTFSASNAICTLTVTKCPYTRNLLN